MFNSFFISELLKTNFILFHVNCHAHVGEQYYFPAEIALLEFNLLNGVSRTFHRIIGLCKHKNIKSNIWQFFVGYKFISIKINTMQGDDVYLIHHITFKFKIIKYI